MEALKPIVKLAVATGCIDQCNTIARLCPSCRSGDRPHRPLSGGPPVLLNRHTIFLKSQCLIESDGLSENFETPKKGLQFLYTRVEGFAVLNSFHSIHDLPLGFISRQSCLEKQKHILELKALFARTFLL